MKHQFRESNANGKLKPERLKAFEAKLGATLPEPYRAFLLKHNGCELGSEEMPTRLFGLHDEKHGSLDGGTYGNVDFLPPEVLTIGLDAGDTSLLIGIAGTHRGKTFRSTEGSDWESASEGGDVWDNVHPAAPDFEALLDLIAADGALADGDVKGFAAYLDEGHDVNAPIFGRLPLETALAEDHIKLAKALMKRGADVMKLDDTIFRSLDGAESIEGLLLYADAIPDINRVMTYEGWTLLDLAVWQDHVEATEALLERGAKPGKETFRLASKSGKQIRALLAPHKK